MGILWRFLDRGMSAPAADGTWRSRLLFALGRWLAVRGGKVRIGNNPRIHPGALINSRNAQIVLGDDVVIAQGTAIQGNVSIGNNCSVQMNGNIVGYPGETGAVRIGDNVRIAAGCMMIAGNHIFADANTPICKQGLSYAPIVIGDDVWLGGRVNVMAGVTIGKGCVIGAGSVVTRDIPPYSVAVGVPARVVKERK